MVVAWPASAAPAPSARWRPYVPAAEPAAPSPSTRTRPGCRRPGSGSKTRPGGPTTAPTGPPWNASLLTCYAAATAADEPASGVWYGWRRTGGCWPPRSTWPAPPPSAYATDPAAGRWLPPSNQPRSRCSILSANAPKRDRRGDHPRRPSQPLVTPPLGTTHLGPFGPPPHLRPNSSHAVSGWRTTGAPLSSDDSGSSVERTAKRHPLWQTGNRRPVGCSMSACSNLTSVIVV
jgi:hypothetical protein